MIISKPDHNDAIESGISLAVATAVEPMAVGLAYFGQPFVDGLTVEAPVSATF